jgi:hypothetical protein
MHSKRMNICAEIKSIFNFASGVSARLIDYQAHISFIPGQVAQPAPGRGTMSQKLGSTETSVTW